MVSLFVFMIVAAEKPSFGSGGLDTEASSPKNLRLDEGLMVLWNYDKSRDEDRRRLGVKRITKNVGTELIEGR